MFYWIIKYKIYYSLYQFFDLIANIISFYKVVKLLCVAIKYEYFI